jgi:hypothetical protein
VSGPASFLYVYCIGRPAIAGALAGLGGIEDSGPPLAIAARGLVAVASEVPAAAYGTEPLHERLTDLAWASEKAWRHERVVETCFLAGPIVPLRFCTIFEARERVEALLEGHAPRLEGILDALKGRAEWGLRGYLDAKPAGSRPGTQELGGSQAGGRAYLEAKKATRDAKKTAALALERALEDTVAALGRAAERAERQPVPPLDAAGDRLALKAAFLVPLDARAAFEATAATETARLAPQGVALQVTGPWPPYSFVPPLEAGREVAEGAP